MDKMEMSKKLEQLVSNAAAKENRLEMTEVLDAFAGQQVTPEEMEDVYRKLELKGVQIQVPEEGEEVVPDSELLLDDETPLDNTGLVREEFKWRFRKKL